MPEFVFTLKKVHYSGEQGKYANELLAAQERAQTARLGLWKNWEPPKEVEEVVVSNGNAEPTSRNVDPKEIAITEVTSNMCFYGQYIANGAKLEELTKQLRNQFAENPPTAGSYTREFRFLTLEILTLSIQRNVIKFALLFSPKMGFGTEERLKKSLARVWPPSLSSITEIARWLKKLN